MKRNHDKWCVNLGMAYHDGKLDIYPIFRTVSCSVATDFREGGYHPYISSENDTLFAQDLREIVKYLSKY